MGDSVKLYEPLRDPVSAQALACTDAVTTYTQSFKNGGAAEEQRVKAKYDALKEASFQLETEQLLLEKWLAAVSSSKKRLDQQEISQLMQQRDEAKKMLSSVRADYGKMREQVKAGSTHVLENYALYEAKRKELIKVLDTLDALLKANGDKENTQVAELEKQLEQTRYKGNQLNVSNRKLGDECSIHEQDIAKLTETANELEKTKNSKDGLKEEENTESEKQLAEAQERLDWVTEMRTILEGLTGVRVRDFQENSFRVESDDLHLRLVFDPSSSCLSNTVMEKSPFTMKSNIALRDTRKHFFNLVLREAVKKNDVALLVRELREFVGNSKQFESEMSKLQSHYPVAMTNIGGLKCEIVVTLPRGLVVTIEVDTSYPRTYSPARLTGIEAFNGWKTSRVNSIMESVIKMEIHTVTELVDEVNKQK
mmetsp:Transcript_18199/g.29579  ORF Transcript_18199/g.29579 Transcript_18199/m.29579 type:complete len:424 (-) Transcript_18199:40-1311(-)